MSVVIVGGNECMTGQYEKVCSSHGYKAKIFAKEKGNFQKKVGNPNLLILFTNPVSHKMVKTALDVAKKNQIPVERLHSSSIAALDTMLAGLNV